MLPALAHLTDPAWLERHAPPSGRRGTLLAALALLAERSRGEPVEIVEVGTIRRRNGMLGDGWAARVWGWYASQVGGRLVSIDTSAPARVIARRVCAEFLPYSHFVIARAEAVLGLAPAPISLLYLDGPSDPAPHLAMLEALRHRPRLVLWDDIVTPGDPAPGFPASSPESVGWLRYAATAAKWANKGESGIPWLLERGYRIVFAVDRQVLLEDPTADWSAPGYDAAPWWADAPSPTSRARPPRPIVQRDPPRRAYEAWTPPADFRTPHVTRPDLALVIGGGATVWEDLRDLHAMVGPWPGLVIGVNDVTCHLPMRVDHWATLHAEKLRDWTARRRQHGHPPIAATWTRRGARSPLADHVISPMGGGASGLLGVGVAQHLGATRVVLCGVPMTREPHFAESQNHKHEVGWRGADSHFRAWRTLAPRLGFVRSFSGRTRDLLGAPTLDWILGNDDAPAAGA